MDLLSSGTLTQLIATYGYLAVLLMVAVESMGIPVPGETTLTVAAIYAGTTHHLNIALVIACAALGAMIGDNAGYFLGRRTGYRLLHRYGRYIRLDERKLRLGEEIFARHGNKVVFFGRFVAFLRMWAAFLAGANRMPWRRFLVFNAAGGAAWACLMGLAGFVFGNTVLQASGPIGIAILALTTLAGLIVPLVLSRRMMPPAEEDVEQRAA
ncbi:MAG TPA: DedA family protein [Chloroflexota bacterium]